jgi:hypothetical protein
MDAGRQAWAWRDWLIDALRDDLPFDQFVVEQLAGDLLPDATAKQRVATGFLRNHVTTDEGGAIDEEYRVEYAAERTATVGSVFLGLTMGCARCHDHKYDPIRQEDYFRLFAFFNSNQEPGLYTQSDDSNRALEPFLQVPSPEQAQRRAELQVQLATAERVLREPSTEEAAAFAAFEQEFAATSGLAWTQPNVTAAESRNGSTLTVAADGTVVAGGKNPNVDVHVVTLTTTATDLRLFALAAATHAELPAGKVGRAPNGNAVLQHVRLEIRPLAAGDAGRDAAEWRRVALIHALADVEQSDHDFTVGNLLDDDDRGWAVGAHQAEPRPARAVLVADAPFGFPGGTELRVTLRYDSVYAQHTFGRVSFAASPASDALLARLPVAASGFYVVGPFPAESAGDLYSLAHGPETVTRVDSGQRWGKLAWRFDAALRPAAANASLPKGRNVTYVAQRLHTPTARRADVRLGSDDGFQLFCNGERVAERRVDRAVAVDQDEAAVDLPAGPATLVLKVVNTGGDGGFALRQIGPERELHADLRLCVLPAFAHGPADAALRARITAAFREHTSPYYRQRREEVAALQKQLAELEAVIPRAMVMAEAEPRPTFVLMRGEYDKPDAQRPVARELPAMFGALPAEAPRNRLGLARWLVGADNPLFLRVQVNRLWEFVFGTGLVRTSEDFGHQGEWPSHPELLDWLATEFAARGHSVRTMLRLLVTSAAFRQQSRIVEAAHAVDRDNRLLSWFPRRRLSAEAIRDQALFVGGMLVERAGGPSVKPLQPAGLWQEVAMTQSNTRAYTAGTGDDLWRRSLYTYWKRACPPPNLLTLDAPTREFCTIRRSTTNTPLQALVLWNDEHFLAAARGLAAIAVRDGGDDEARLAAMFRRCTGQRLAGADLAAAMATLRTLQARYRADPGAATALAQPAAADAAAVAGDAATLAPFVLLASAFLALDATLCLD